MSRRHSGLITSAVTLETLRFHHLNSHVKRRLHTACTNTSESVLTLLTLIGKHYKSISCPFLVIWSKSVRTLSLTLAPARSGQIGSVSPPQASVLLRSSSDLPKKFPYNTSQTTQSTLKNTLPHSITTPKNTPEHSVSGAGLC